jgi:hypothetical protein
MKIFFMAMLMLLTLTISRDAQAYVGPGAGLSAIGSVLAFLCTVFLLIVGFFWYPVKRLLKRIKRKNIAE